MKDLSRRRNFKSF